MKKDYRVRGKLNISKNMIAPLIGLPDDVRIASVVYDVKREVIEFILESDEPVEDFTFAITETSDTPEAFYGNMNTTLLNAHYQIYESMRNLIFGIEEGPGVMPSDDDIEEIGVMK